MDNLTFSLFLENVGADIRFDYFNASGDIRPSSLAFHDHTVYEVYFIERGELTLCVSDAELTLRAHDILIIPPNTVHRIKEYTNGIKRFNLRFLLNTHARYVTHTPFLLYTGDDRIKQEIFDSIEKIYRHMPQVDRPWEFFRVKSYFGVILSYLVEPLLPEQRKQDAIHTAKNKIDQHIQIDRFFSEHFAKAITAADLAHELHYSKTHVNRLLRQYWGMSFSEKLDQTRLQAAKQYLREGKEPIHTVAERCGYATLRGFELFFRKHTGMLPKEYRKRERDV